MEKILKKSSQKFRNGFIMGAIYFGFYGNLFPLTLYAINQEKIIAENNPY